MFKLSVLDGPQVDLGQMLAAKDARMTKEYDWLKANPDNDLLLPDEVVEKTVAKYKEAFELLTGKPFQA